MNKEQILENDYPFLKPAKTDDPNAFPTIDEFRKDLCSWEKMLENYTSSSKFTSLYSNVKDAYGKANKCYPPVNQIFNCFQATNIKDIKVVIVGQDPYHQPGQAMGLCFSVAKGVKIPPSLRNMYKELDGDSKIDFKIPKHGDLTKWANQGVFLINNVLTVEDSKADSHKDFGWKLFTTEVIKLINDKLEGVIFL